MNNQSLRVYHLKPGFIFCSAAAPLIISAVLGSCVAVTLYDRKNRFGAMNHYAYPWLKRGEIPATLGGQPAMLRMLRVFKLKGADFNSVEAQIFGGAVGPNATGFQVEIGRRNHKIAEAVLYHYGIKVTSSDVGGFLGRKVMFNSRTGEVVVAKVDRIRSDDWYPGIKDLSKAG